MAKLKRNMKMQDKYLKFSDFNGNPYEDIRNRAKNERSAAIRNAFRAIFGGRTKTDDTLEF